MAEIKCSTCGARLKSEDDICGACDVAVDPEIRPSEKAPPPPPISVPPPLSIRHASLRVVGDIMTRKVATLFEGEPLTAADVGLRKFKFGHIPVVGPDGYFIGLLSHRELLRALPSPLDEDSATKQEELLSQHRVGDIMTRDAKTVSAETSLYEAGQLMIDEKRNCLPVVDDDGKLIGVVTATDYVRLAVSLVKPQ